MKKHRNKITLYHFAEAFTVPSIREQGLTLGKFPKFNGKEVELLNNCQWLTSEPDPRRQSWATRVTYPGDRTECRLTVEIPASHRRKLVPAREFVQGWPEESREIVDAWPGSECWYIFLGRVPPSWIVGCTDFRKAGKR